jgi:lon-related putative ATP-dependent protease
MIAELPAEALRNICDPNTLECETSADIPPLSTIVGQARAVRALQFGLGIQSLGFNIYIAGLPGTGRTTAARRFLEDIAKDQPTPDDWCYVNNFQDPYRPNALRLPAGRARQLQADMQDLILDARKAIRAAFESDEYAAKRDETMRQFQEQRNALFTAIQEKAARMGFYIQATPMGFLTIPIREGKPLTEELFMVLPPEEQEQIRQAQAQLQEELKGVIRQARSLEKLANEALQKLDREVTTFALTPLIEEVREKYEDCPEVVQYLHDVQNDILDNLALFREEQPAQASPAGMPADPFRKYQVNVLVDNSSLKGAPVIIELNPTYNNLFGRIEKEAQFGALFTDFTLIREGSLHRANGGYLVLPVEEVLRNLFSWESLKRALRNAQIVIEEPGERLGFITTKTLRPEPIPLNIKVILIGQPYIYYLLYNLDEDFKELFKVKADFDYRMDRTPEAVREYISFVCTLCQEENLRHLDRTALAKIIEHGSRLAEDQEKLSTLFGDLSDVIREAHHYAVRDQSPLVTAAHVTQAINERYYRSNLVEQRVQEAIARGIIQIDVAGAEVGQVNGLSIIDLGDITFGRPNRITASVGLGTEGLIDIEREAKLGGPIHTKGVLILAGYLSQQYAQDKPLSLSARLVFEQSYSGVEGDSASSTELYALLSALSGLPIQQGIAVTGSVNQKGEVQAIGGVNEKIEGFFAVCKAMGLNGRQGVIIPASNVKHLMLKDEVVEAVRQGQFHIWAVHTVDEGIEILTGVPAGKRLPDGTFEPGTVHYLVDQRLRQFSEKMREFGKEGAGEEEEEEEQPPAQT